MCGNRQSVAEMMLKIGHSCFFLFVCGSPSDTRPNQVFTFAVFISGPFRIQFTCRATQAYPSECTVSESVAKTSWKNSSCE